MPSVPSRVCSVASIAAPQLGASFTCPACFAGDSLPGFMIPAGSSAHLDALQRARPSLADLPLASMAHDRVRSRGGG